MATHVSNTVMVLLRVLMRFCGFRLQKYVNKVMLPAILLTSLAFFALDRNCIQKTLLSKLRNVHIIKGHPIKSWSSLHYKMALYVLRIKHSFQNGFPKTRNLIIK